MAQSKPNLFIIGQPKSGTSALYSFLRQHPDICMGSTKEPQYFCRDLRSQYFHLARLERTDENYLKLFSHCGEKPVLGEASTAYLYSRQAAQEIAAFNPDAKIIAILREPVDFLYSYHLQLQRNSCLFETEEDFVTALDLEDSRKNGENIPPGCFDPQFLYYAERTRYVEQLQRYYAVFPEQQIMVVIYDDFQADNARIYKEVVDFLGIDADFVPDMAMVNTKVRARNRRLKQAADQLIFPLKQRLRTLLPNRFYKASRSLYRRMIFSKAPIPPLDETTRQALKQRYLPQVQQLSEFLHRDLVAQWNYQPPG